MNNVDLSQMKGLHIPQTPDIFPLALGWWLLIGLIAVLIFGTYIGLLWYFESKRRFVLQEIKRIKKIKSTQQLLLAFNELAKKIAIDRFGREKIAPLYGKSWVDFLNSGKKEIFSKDYVDLLHKSLYAGKKDISDSWKKRIIRDYEKWIRTFLKK